MWPFLRLAICIHTYIYIYIHASIFWRTVCYFVGLSHTLTSSLFSIEKRHSVHSSWQSPQWWVFLSLFFVVSIPTLLFCTCAHLCALYVALCFVLRCTVVVNMISEKYIKMNQTQYLSICCFVTLGLGTSPFFHCLEMSNIVTAYPPPPRPPTPAPFRNNIAWREHSQAARFASYKGPAAQSLFDIEGSLLSPLPPSLPPSPLVCTKRNK